ncbi:MAG: acyl-CoA dehydrogenase family protein, partial [Alphaproteobacteria bacterium]|nr:acyl-CoA dehydrogenase family protein [Alphaproteobacteria bacterium]
MDMQFTAADLAFRDEVRAFLATELPDDIRERWQNGSLIFPDRDDAVRWQKILHRKGWIAPNWPKEHGGPGWTVSQKFIFETEMAEAGAPPVIPLGLRMVGPVIMRYGTPEQKARFLPRILATDD